jgi:hypothetical protein
MKKEEKQVMKYVTWLSSLTDDQRKEEIKKMLKDEEKRCQTR